MSLKVKTLRKKALNYNILNFKVKILNFFKFVIISAWQRTKGFRCVCNKKRISSHPDVSLFFSSLDFLFNYFFQVSVLVEPLGALSQANTIFLNFTFQRSAKLNLIACLLLLQAKGRKSWNKTYMICLYVCEWSRTAFWQFYDHYYILHWKIEIEK